MGDMIGMISDGNPQGREDVLMMTVYCAPKRKLHNRANQKGVVNNQMQYMIIVTLIVILTDQ